MRWHCMQGLPDWHRGTTGSRGELMANLQCTAGWPGILGPTRAHNSGPIQVIPQLLLLLTTHAEGRYSAKSAQSRCASTVQRQQHRHANSSAQQPVERSQQGPAKISGTGGLSACNRQASKAARAQVSGPIPATCQGKVEQAGKNSAQQLG